MIFRWKLILTLGLVLLVGLGLFFWSQRLGRSDRRPSPRTLLIYRELKGGFVVDSCKSC